MFNEFIGKIVIIFGVVGGIGLVLVEVLVG